MNHSLRNTLLAVLATSGIAAGVGYFYFQKNDTSASTALLDTTSQPITTETLAPPLPSAAESLTALFGIKAITNQVANSPSQLSSIWFSQPFTQAARQFQVVFVKTQSLDPESGTVLESHADAATISAVVYQLENNQWQIFSKQINFGSFGSWGDVPKIEHTQTLQLSTDQLVFLIDSGFTGQGYTEEGKGLFSFNLQTKRWKELGFISTGGDNSGVCDETVSLTPDPMSQPCWQFSGEITLADKTENSNYPNLLVTAKGTVKGENNKIIPAPNQLYVFKGDHYVESPLRE